MSPRKNIWDCPTKNNEVERLFAFSENRIQIECLEKELCNQQESPPTPLKLGTLTLADHLREVERTIILETLIRNQFNIRKTAQELGVSRGTLYNKIISLGIKRHGYD